MLIDVNCSLGNWPFMRFAQDTPAKLAKHLAAEGVTTALVSALDNVLYPDFHTYNCILRKKLKPYPSLIPVMTLNPAMSHWRDSLAQYDAAETAHTVKIFPNYHRYSLTDPCVDQLMCALAKRPKRTLIIQMRIEDERNQYPLMKIPGVPAGEIIQLANRYPRHNILCLCPYRAEAITLVRETKNVSVDISFCEFLNTLKTLLRDIPARRLFFGSNTPMLYTRAAGMKIKLAEIPKQAMRAITAQNARRLFKL